MTSKRNYQGDFESFPPKKTRRTIVSDIHQAYYNCDIEEVKNLLNEILESEVEELDEFWNPFQCCPRWQ